MRQRITSPVAAAADWEAFSSTHSFEYNQRSSELHSVLMAVNVAHIRSQGVGFCTKHAVICIFIQQHWCCWKPWVFHEVNEFPLAPRISSPLMFSGGYWACTFMSRRQHGYMFRCVSGTTGGEWLESECSVFHKNPSSCVKIRLSQSRGRGLAQEVVYWMVRWSLCCTSPDRCWARDLFIACWPSSNHVSSLPVFLSFTKVFFCLSVKRLPSVTNLKPQHDTAGLLLCCSR